MRRPTEPSERLQRILDGPDPDPIGRTVEPGPRVVTVPSQLASARWAISPKAAIGVGLLLLVAVAVLVLRLGIAQRASEPVPVDPPTGGVVAKGDRSAFASPGTTGVGATPAASPAITIYVHVVGRVRRPGIVELPNGARVADAVKAVGGVAKGADLTSVNLARPVLDGEQVLVPEEGEAVPPAVSAAPGVPGAPAAPGGPDGVADAPVNLNTADQTTLEGLPGVGPVLAERIIEWRTTNGRFTTVDELSEVSGIGEKLFAQISPKVVV